MKVQTRASHPFGELLRAYRQRKPGLSQERLAHRIGYDQSVLVRMSQGKKDLTGPSGRDRVVQLIEALHELGVLATLEEANGLLLAADMQPLFERRPLEARLLARLSTLPSAKNRNQRSNLPAPLASFIGRAGELAEIRALLGMTRLLTLTGAGGCGKTRLAQQAAADALPAYGDGVWQIELAALSDAERIPDTVARALGLIGFNTTAMEQLLDHLATRHTLLLIDNCEHLLEPVALFAIALLRACPHVTLLTTSREMLNVEGETTWRVPPMQTAEACLLFVHRAASIRHELLLRPQEPLVEQICTRLDGMPLAIELAAVRLQSMGLAELATRLDDRFNLLTHGRVGALPRHQTLHALIDWSHATLSDAEQIVFRRLGVFVGGWNLAQAENTVCDHLIKCPSILPTLERLADKSLITLEAHQHGTRHRFLETIRAYALEKLDAAGETQRLRERHTTAYVELASEATVQMQGGDQKTGIRRMRDEQGNLSAALDWSLSPNGNALLGCRLVASLNEYWDQDDARMNSDVLRWVSAAVNVVTSEMPADVQGWVWLTADDILGFVTPYSRRALALFEASCDRANAIIAMVHVGRTLAYERNFPAAVQMHQDAVDEARAFGDDRILSFSLGMCGEILRHTGQLEQADVRYREALALQRASGDLKNAAVHLLTLSASAKERMEFAESLHCSEEALALARSIENASLELQARCQIAEDVFYLGDAPRAVVMLEDCVAVADDHVPDRRAKARLFLAKALLATGDPAHAHAVAVAVLQLRVAQATRGARVRSDAFDVLSVIAAGRGDAITCARLCGFVDRLMTELIHYRRANLAWEFAPYFAMARAALGDTAFAAAHIDGEALSMEQAMAFALKDIAKPVNRQETAHTPAPASAPGAPVQRTAG